MASKSMLMLLCRHTQLPLLELPLPLHLHQEDLPLALPLPSLGVLRQPLGRLPPPLKVLPLSTEMLLLSPKVFLLLHVGLQQALPSLASYEVRRTFSLVLCVLSALLFVDVDLLSVLQRATPVLLLLFWCQGWW